MRTNLPYIAFYVAMLTACGEGDVVQFTEHDVSNVAIVPNADVGISVSTRAALSGSVEGTAFPSSTESVFAVTSLVKLTGSESTEIAYFANAPVNTDADGNLSFATGDYFYLNGYTHYFYAFSPAESGLPEYSDLSSTSPTVTFTIDGQQDIMWAKDESGVVAVTDESTQPQPSFNFKHLLKKIHFEFIQGTGFADNIHVTKIRVKNTHKYLTLNLLDGTLVPTYEEGTDDEGTEALEIAGTWAITDYNDEGQGCTILCEPGPEIDLEIDAAGVTYTVPHIDLSELKSIDSSEQDSEQITSGGAGVSYLIKITFLATYVKDSEEITNWVEITTGSSSESESYDFRF